MITLRTHVRLSIQTILRKTVTVTWLRLPIVTVTMRYIDDITTMVTTSHCLHQPPQNYIPHQPLLYKTAGIYLLGVATQPMVMCLFHSFTYMMTSACSTVFTLNNYTSQPKWSILELRFTWFPLFRTV